MKAFNENIDLRDAEFCKEHCLHREMIEEAKREKPDDVMIDDMAELFKVFGDPTRVKILYTLFDREMCVCDIAEYLEMTQSAISHQLRTLKKARLVKFRKEGKTVFYSLDDDHVRYIFDFGLRHIKEIYK